MTGPAPVVVAEFRAVHDATVGGPDKTILWSAAHHDPARVRVVPFYLVPPDDPMSALRRLAGEAGVEPVLLEDRGPIDPSLPRRVRAGLREHGCHLLHTHDFKTDVYGPWIVRGTGLGLLATAHGWSRPGSDAKLRFYNRVDRYALRRFPHVVAVSESQRNLLRASGVSDHVIEVVPNAIDVDRWRPAGGGGIPPGLPEAGPRVGTVLRLSADKDVEGLIDAFAGLPGSPRLVIVGDGPLRADLERRAAASGAGERVSFLGRREDVAAVLGHLDLFVLPTRAEGLPNSVLEAMALARPIVAHRVGGVPELVRDGEEALLVAPGDTAGLRSAMARVLADDALAGRLARAARRRVEEEFSFAVRLARMEDIYERIATGGPDGGDAA